MITIPRASRDDLKASIELVEEVHAPINQGDQLGTLTVTLPEGNEITVPLEALNSVEESGFFTGLVDSIMLFSLKLMGGDPLEFKP